MPRALVLSCDRGLVRAGFDCPIDQTRHRMLRSAAKQPRASDMFHALWGMVQFLGGLWRAQFWHLVEIGIVVNVLSGAMLRWIVLRKRHAATAGRGVAASSAPCL